VVDGAFDVLCSVDGEVVYWWCMFGVYYYYLVCCVCGCMVEVEGFVVECWVDVVVV